jgi:hypothetical protein
MHPYVLDALARDRMQQANGRSAALRLAGRAGADLSLIGRLRAWFTRSARAPVADPPSAPVARARRTRPVVPAARPRSVRPQPRRVMPHAARITRECRRVFG